MRTLFFVFGVLYFVLFPFRLNSQINTERLLSIGKSALYYEDYVISIQYFNRIIRLKPYLYEPYILRGIAKVQLGDYTGALADCDAALERNPYQAGIYYTRGFVFRELGDYAKAEDDFSKALCYSPENRTYMALRADVRARLEEFDSAMLDIDYLIRKEPRSGSLHFERGVICLSMRDTVGAYEAFEKATKFDSQNSAGWSALGLVDLMMNRMDAALLNLNNAIRLGSKWEGDYINRAILFYRKHNYVAALSDFGKALTIQPHHSETYYNRGILRMELGDYNRALEDLDKAVEYAQDVAPCLYQRILVLLQLRQWEKALEDIRRLIRMHPHFLPSYYLAAQAYTALGLRKEANTARQEAYLLEQRRDSLRSSAQEDLNTDLHLATSQPPQRDRRKEFSTSETQEEIQAEEGAQEENFTLRGNIQHKRVDVVNENMIFLSYFPQTSNIRQTNYTHAIIDHLNNLRLLSSSVYLSLQEPTLGSEDINLHFDRITSLSDRISLYEEKRGSISDTAAFALYFDRAMEFAVVQDYFSATEDCTRALKILPSAALIYFCRAYWRLKHIEFESSVSFAEKSDIDIDVIIRDYDSCIRMVPDFSFAFYDKANMLCIQKRYDEAIKNYSVAIGVDDEFAEAYFNRGLTYIYNDDIERGIADLSKAGELGIYQAYNLISRFK